LQEQKEREKEWKGVQWKTEAALGEEVGNLLVVRLKI